MLNVDFRSLEPFVRGYEPPDCDKKHWPAIHKTRPVHVRRAIDALAKFMTVRQMKVTHVRSAPTTLGKHKMGTMSATKADANTPMGMDSLPKFHGPGRNLFPTKKTRMKMGIVNALHRRY
jgi:hypothetical protein